MKNLNKKQKIILSIIGIGIISLIALGITYAYFIAVVEPGEKAPVDIITDTTDNLLFDVEDNINLAINKYNFGPGNGDLTSTAKATATLRANSTDNTATYNYYLYFNIESNEFVYTTEDHKPEIILTITGPDGEVKTLEGLTYVTVGPISGFDITTASGLFEIANNYAITSNSSTTDTVQEWDFTATFINLDSDQNDNTGKSMNGQVLIQSKIIPRSISEACNEGNNLSNCLIGYVNEDLTKSSDIIYHNGRILDINGNVLDANDGSYRYSGADTKAIADAHKEEYTTILRTASTAISETYKPLIWFMCGETETYIGATCNEEIQYYFLHYDESKTQYEHYNLALEQAIKDGYVERNYVDNFVCFGSNEEVCPYDNLYRIIGVFDNKVKLIKHDVANESLLGTNGERGTTNIKTTTGTYRTYYRGYQPLLNTYYWNKINFDSSNTELGYSNIWKNSELNKTNLNTNYLNNIGEEWSSKIAISTWSVGGNLYTKTRTNVTTVYQNEIKAPVTTVPSTYEAKIGLMYISDYGYANSQTNWTKSLSTATTSRTTNWMYTGIKEWTISRFADETNDNYKKSVAYLNYTSIIGSYTTGYVNTIANAVRPVFYLNSNITYVSGDGSIENPIRIGV